MLNVYVALMGRIAELQRREEGQTMAEYAVILTLIAVVVAAALVTLQGNISGALTSVGSRL